ncbi:glycosyltransferase [Baekduia soli]|uniref:Glycosyltransferase n=1 Tax=Baekduia soli TaxID=496014 RepID=A0A5B8UBS6_9ACTN|nr:glycosyltransferase family 2 protein [Baekduia soli]QEC50091.1 glycosyltransferase [Baekduia soli]
MRVSVIIPTRNGAARLPGVLGALAAQTPGAGDFEVIIVDDGSGDDTAAVAAAAGARVVSVARSGGPGAATNRGIAQATGQLMAFTDDDTIPASDWIERGRAALQASPAGLVAGHIELQLADRPTVPAMMDFGRGYLDQSAYVADGFGATANLWATRDVVSRLGGFDGSAAWQTHDRDFGERARIAGITMVYAREVVVAHPTRDGVRELARVAYRLGQGATWLSRNGVGAARRHVPEWRRPRYWIPWRSIWGLERLQARGLCTTRTQRLALRVVQYGCLQLPLVAGSLRGTLDGARAAR